MSKSVKYIALTTIIVSLVAILFWQIFFNSINYYIVSVIILILSMLPFFISFEKATVSAREVAFISTLIALAVVSRVAFYLVPQVKPIAAVVIAGAVCLGPQRGYIIGAFSAFVSNFIFGQGVWTPFQMVALGLVGFIAGVIFKTVKHNRFTLSIVGFVLSFALYGLIVDMSTILMMYGNHITWASVISVYGAGVPFSLIFGVSTAVFLLLFGEPFIKKINRVNIKYSLLTI